MEKYQLAGKVQEQGGVYHDILTTLVNICQLKAHWIRTAPSYIWQQQVRKGMAMTHANVKILRNGVKSSALTFMPLGHVPQFYNDAPSNARDIHSIAMQEQPMDMQSSFKCVYVRNYSPA